MRWAGRAVGGSGRWALAAVMLAVLAGCSPPRPLVQLKADREAVSADGQARRWTLSERIVVENLTDHYVHQLNERLRWATADAEDLEAHFANARDDLPRQRWK